MLLEIDPSSSAWIIIGRAVNKPILSNYFISYKACIVTYVNVIYSTSKIEMVTVFLCLLFYKMDSLAIKICFSLLNA